MQKAPWQQLGREGLELTMLSGDSREAVDRVADRLAIKDRPCPAVAGNETRQPREHAQGGKHVLMVGDGVNDAPVLAAADVSMTVKGGAELANSAADMILTSDSLGLVNKAIETARRTRSWFVRT